MNSKYEWNLKEIFESREEFDATKRNLEKDLENINSYQGKLCDNSENLFNCYQYMKKH